MRLIIPIILSLCLLSIHSQYCSASYAFVYSGYDCVFDYDYSDPNCTQFNFKECSWVECVEWVQSGNDTVCGRTQTFWDYSWNYCTRQCCDYNVVYPYDYSSLYQCQEYLNSQQKIFLIIILSIVGVIVAILLAVGICSGSLGRFCSKLKDSLGSCYEVICGCPCFRKRSSWDDRYQRQVDETNNENMHIGVLVLPHDRSKSNGAPQTPTPS